MNKETKLQVEAIRSGTVIDHIPANVGFKLLTLFNLTKTDQRVTIGLNLPSNALGKKDLIKIENTFLTEAQANQLSIYAPKATVNQIDNYEVVRKLTLSLPESVNGILKCPNSNCISRFERDTSNFAVKQINGQIRLQCRYCEKEFDHQTVIKDS